MSINFTINGKPYKVEPNELPADTTLNTYIREHANLPGTKFMCLEGGCGVCVCVIKGRHPVSKDYQTWATNSCLTMLYSCDGWDIVTIEGLGSKIKGYHPIQERLAHLNGSQCGYCSPAMVMNMYALLEGRGKITVKEVQNSFGGSICRCTGYRPILDAMGSFASDTDFVCKDIEDIGKLCPKTGSACAGMCKSSKLDVVTKDGTQWISAYSLKDIFDAFGKIGDKKYMLVAGNTGHGVFRRDPDIEVFIDVNKVPELHTHNIGDTLELGGNLSLTETMDIFTAAATKPGYEYCTNVYDHFDVIANVPVRNMGTLAGNLSMKHAVKEFPSDIFLTFEALDAKIVVAEDPSKTVTLSVQEYLATDMRKKVLKGFILPNYDPRIYFFNSYKIMPRAQNAHAYVNGAFLVKCTSDKIDWARLCFGGITAEFIHAKNTEDFITGKDIFDNEIFKKSMEILKSELNPDWVLPDASPDYRRLLACGLFYKYVISVTPDGRIKPEFKTGGPKLQRDVSSGVQTFETNAKAFPLTEPMPKMEALVQCSGEATYMNDYPNVAHQLWAAFVHATEANSKIAKIDESEALKVPGVVAFYSAKDIPGVNSFVTKGLLGFFEDEEIFCSETIKYHAQPIGMIVAESTKIATMAANKVKVMYEKQAGVVMATLDDVLEHKATHRMRDTIVTPDRHIPDLVKATKKVTGQLDLGSQYHFTMEPQTTVCIPTEDGMEIYCATQFVDNAQTSIAKALNVNVNSIRLNVRRLGGGYGAKVSRSSQIGCAAALACQKLGRPIRFVQTIESMMSSLGKRFACHSDYEVDVDDKGKIIKLKNNFYEDAGCTANESPVNFLTIHCVRSCYINGDNWIVNGKEIITDAPSHTWCRAPGALEGIAMAETVIEHIARETNRDPVDVRMENISKDHKIASLLPEYMNTVEYKKRKEEINKFNTDNRWRKRGIGVAVMQYPIDYFGQFGATVTIYHGDGTVGVSHGGIEMGQGIHTKAAQVAAHILGIPLSKVKVEPSDSFTSPNGAPTGGTIASECVAYATKKACEDLLERLKPVRESMKDATWEELIDKAFQQNVNLIAQNCARREELKEYAIYGVACSEVEVDILTGNLIVKRVDILEDTGESLSPMIDVGQIESAFIMGLGYWLTELLVFNRETGELLTTRTWNYKPPGPKDIPVDFRINLLQKSPNPAGVLRSKATGEPPMCLSISIIFAIRHALESSREQSGVKEKWFHLGAPTTPEHIMLNAGITPEMFSLA